MHPQCGALSADFTLHFGLRMDNIIHCISRISLKLWKLHAIWLDLPWWNWQKMDLPNRVLGISVEKEYIREECG